MPTYVKTHDETSPAGSRAISLGDDDIRDFKYEIRERLATDHKFSADETGITTIGYHQRCTFIEAADIGTGATGLPILGAQTADGKPELTFTNEDDTLIQITKGIAIYGDAVRMSNNTYLKAIDAAGTGEVNLIKANASDVAVLTEGSELATSGAQTADADIANKKYIDDQIHAIAANSDDVTTTAIAGMIPKLDANGCITPFLRVYDTGAAGITWVANTAYTVTHNLNTTAVIVQFFFRENNGIPWRICTGHRDNGIIGVTADTVNANTIVFTMSNAVSAGSANPISSGQYRVIVLAVG